VAWLYGVAPDTADHYSRWVAGLALVALVSSFLVSYVKARAESLGFECNVGIAERGERVVIVIIALVFDVLPWGIGLLAAFSTITFLQRIFYVKAQEKDRVAS
jgi:CDP-diacylglycerol--glycerol-3-phosphate 3-phosphatidyltransferase